MIKLQSLFHTWMGTNYLMTQSMVFTMADDPNKSTSPLLNLLEQDKNIDIFSLDFAKIFD